MMHDWDWIEMHKPQPVSSWTNNLNFFPSRVAKCCHLENLGFFFFWVVPVPYILLLLLIRNLKIALRSLGSICSKKWDCNAAIYSDLKTEMTVGALNSMPSRGLPCIHIIWFYVVGYVPVVSSVASMNSPWNPVKGLLVKKPILSHDKKWSTVCG